jgi:hypothetical protein
MACQRRLPDFLKIATYFSTMQNAHFVIPSLGFLPMFFIVYSSVLNMLLEMGSPDERLCANRTLMGLGVKEDIVVQSFFCGETFRTVAAWEAVW